MDDEGGGVHRAVALDDLTRVVDQDEVGHRDVAEVHSEWVDPEVVQPFRITRGDVAGHPLVESELGEEPERGSQPLLAVELLHLGRLECHPSWGFHDLWHRVLLLDRCRRHGRTGTAPILRPRLSAVPEGHPSRSAKGILTRSDVPITLRPRPFSFVTQDGNVTVVRSICGLRRTRGRGAHGGSVYAR